MSPQPKNPPAPNGDGATTADPKESKEDRFKRVAAQRTDKALQAIDHLRQTTNPGNYTYSAEQADKIVAALQGKVDALKESFANGGKSAPTFSL